jgi:hypothetical protein
MQSPRKGDQFSLAFARIAVECSEKVCVSASGARKIFVRDFTQMPKFVWR